MDLHVVEIHVEGYVTGVEKIISKILLDHITFIATADHELVDAVMAVGFKNMPENRFSTHLHHWLGFEMGFLG
jgi:hypothetical protein